MAEMLSILSEEDISELCSFLESNFAFTPVTIDITLTESPSSGSILAPKITFASGARYEVTPSPRRVASLMVRFEPPAT